MRFRRVVWVVLDSVGIGAMPDWQAFGDDMASDTLGNCARLRPLQLPHLCELGLANIRPFEHLAAAESPRGSHGRCALASPGKDTTTGHWEMAGVILEKPFPVYPNGFPRELMDEYERRIGRGTLGNIAASGTEIIRQLGPEHMATGKPIVYTSADSVFQICLLYTSRSSNCRIPRWRRSSPMFVPTNTRARRWMNRSTSASTSPR